MLVTVVCVLSGEREDYYCATILDPRFKHYDQWPTNNPNYKTEFAKRMVLGTWTDVFKPSERPGLQQAPLRPVAKKSTLTTDFAGYAAPAASDAGDELAQYLAEPPEPDAEDFNKVGIFKYWESRRIRWPNLTRMWRQFHGSPATSGGIERIFWRAGKAHDDLRKSTKETSIEAILMAGVNSFLRV
eukprot:GHVU01067468.1.p1 GENE.GHVU01067468.1~~GHVU01067468.1.p1  ORF type:complete len:186 (+),score=24.99 GHVU01067468.1:45-602(+)